MANYMQKNPFNGQLNSNEIFSAIYNMIVGQWVFADQYADNYSELLDKIKMDASQYGDTWTFYASDVLHSNKWNNDSEAGNLLSLDRPYPPEVQAITLDQFRQIRLTVDDYLSKRAWSTESAFSSFNSVMLGWIAKTKRIYESTLINSYIGTVETQAAKKELDIDLTTALTGLSGVEKDIKEATTIAKSMADLFVDMKDISRDYNDYDFLDSYKLSDLYVVWSSDYVNKIRKVDVPALWHNEGLVDKFDEVVLPSKYFGTVITSTNVSSYSDSTPTTGKPIDSDTGAYTPGVANANGKICSLIETTFAYTRTESVNGSNTTTTEYRTLFPGQEIPAGATIGSGKDFEYGEVYIVDPTIICKVLHNNSVKMLGSFDVGTSFFNPRSLTTNNYLTWGYSHPDYLRRYPIVVVKEV